MPARTAARGAAGLGMLLVLLCLLPWAVTPAAQAGEPPVATIVLRLGDYLSGFAKSYAQVVAEERYTQTLKPKRPLGGVTGSETRVIDADMVAVSDSTRAWLNFRDVFAVDRRPVRDRDERLTKLFFTAPGVTPGAPADPLARARDIADEGARFNLGTLSRNVNFPAMALNYLSPERLAALTVRRDRREKVAGVETIALKFDEVARPTVVRSLALDVPARGRLWVEPVTGRLMKTELILEGKDFTSRSTVTYGYVEKLAMWLPVEMVDQATGARDVIDGRAVYTNFRRFGTTSVIK